MNAVVLIPAFCPDDVLLEIVERLLSFDLKVVIVNDGSGQEYQALFTCLGKLCVVLTHEQNRGKGVAIKTGLSYIAEAMTDCNLVGVMDADGQHTPEDMIRVLFEAESHPRSFVLGCRNIREMPFRSRIGNKITRTVFNHLYKMKISDTQTGMRAFSTDEIPMLLTVEGSGYEYEMNALVVIAQRHMSVIEVPIHTIYRDSGNSSSHFHVIRDSFRIYRKIFLFALSSFSGFLIDYVLFSLMTLFLPHTAYYLLADNIIARMVSGYCNYRINCTLVFREKSSTSTALDISFWQHAFSLPITVF
jgi:glycosyltransferase involved in cell wall biosynthesis